MKLRDRGARLIFRERWLSVVGRWAFTGIVGCGAGTLPGAESETELTAGLIPSPRQLAVQGERQLLGEGKLVIAGTLGTESIAWDPLAILKGVLTTRNLEWRSPPGAARQGAWSIALTSDSARLERLPPADDQARLDPVYGQEAYRLETFPGPPGVYATVIAGGPRGLLYGLQTLSQLLARTPGTLPHVAITDWPDIAGIRELHVHGFDKGYGAGDFKSLAAFTRDLPAILPQVSSARFNLFRFSLDAGWINTVDQWLPGQDVDAVMRGAVERCHRHGVDALIEVRFEGQRAGSVAPDPYPLNPLSEWNYYEKALRRALSWGPDVLDLSLNDLQPINTPDVVAKYGTDGRFSGALMAEMLHQARSIIDQVKPNTRLHHLPRFYGDVHWQRNPKAMPELWSGAPKGVLMYATSSLSHPVLLEMRRKYGAQFVLWTNYTSNHAKELKVLLTGTAPDIARVIGLLPPSERHVLINLGYPIAPQYPVVLATGELLWNHDAYDTFGSLSKSARRVWGGEKPGDLFLRYARLLDGGTIMASRGVAVADLLLGKRQVADDEPATAGPAPAGAGHLANWKDYRERANEAERVARLLQGAVPDQDLKRVAEVLYWNAKRVELDARTGELAAAGLAAGRIDTASIKDLLREHEQLILDHYPVEPNDPKSAEVVTRGIRRIREALKKSAPLHGQAK